MNMYAMHTTAAALFALSAFASSAQDPAWVADARKVAGSVPPKLIAVLNDEIAKGGPEGAIAVCRDKAPELARAASTESGWAIRRQSRPDPRCDHTQETRVTVSLADDGRAPFPN